MDVQDLVGIGFGPSNMGLAIALKEDFASQTAGRKLIFLEGKTTHSWHHPMMLPNAKMQISFMKDLCFLRNPASAYTFVNYLHQQQRLARFANLRDFNPSRKEFDDYLRWVACQFSDITRYASRVEAVLPVEHRGQVTHLDVRVRNTLTQDMSTLRTRNLVLAIGGQPVMPVKYEHPHVFHSSSFLQRITQYDNSRPQRFMVVGAGQSAAEIYQYLIDRFPSAEVRVVCSGIGFKQADDSAYINEIFDHAMVDRFFNLNERERSALLSRHHDSNYAVADLALIEQLYREEYEASIGDNRQRFGMLKFSRLISLSHDQGIHAQLRSTLDGHEYSYEADVVVFATGYHRRQNHTLLKAVSPWLAGSEDQPRLTRSYTLATHESFAPRIYIQGMSEATHGLSDTLLSVISRRSHDIARDFVEQSTMQPVHQEPVL
ncbi:SidA/IucD/PvdA family monooxygenase [Pseudomonas sp. M5]|uniref:SidA/IucD/PvdA family monooxygenase n=1 Tax=Pseudomonas sp. M5 TaxID=1620788 RepID=UPI00195BCC57|nr:SidA/IucD/PvdA family monooxygenase [Pseudomonas sp. M5]MBM7395524.1 L-ornithine N5-oxygenase [Pseudomonas sp. M5]HDS1758849.1 lysine N(6)-hydroxylase/L-ornithine N(5)-oxygenase family protein [Pseudomonas putida]